MRLNAARALLGVILVSALPLFASAQQYDIPGASNALSIVMTPAQPEPKSTVRLTLQSPIYDLDTSLISWRVNGEPLSEGEGLKSVSIVVGAAGESTDVSAGIIHGDDDAVAYTVITPAIVDLMWEAEGLVPPLYKGRTLSAVGSRLTFVAYPTFVQDGKRIPEKDLIYTWRKNDSVLGSLSGKGKSTLTISSPTLFGAETISVEARTQDGAIAAKATTRVATPDTPLRLYENHPLFGPMLHKAFGATAFTPETEMTFVAIPFFAPVANENDPKLEYSWRVNQSAVKSDAKRPSQITINAAGSTGVALIELTVGHASNFFFGSDAAWQVTFSKADSGATGSNPFAPQQ